MSEMIEFKLTRKDKPPIFAYFKTIEDLKQFTIFLEELIENVKKKTIGEMKKPSTKEKEDAK